MACCRRVGCCCGCQVIPGGSEEFNVFIEQTMFTDRPDVFLGILQSGFILGEPPQANPHPAQSHIAGLSIARECRISKAERMMPKGSGAHRTTTSGVFPHITEASFVRTH